ncbi:hypothetical protein B9Z65_3129 [Elsinoe australis]|uniref:Uncharacterized protein n=1 Tax=Elsinoe australis TaxID=40998 RepID=A0A2P7ZUH7_9PEZI|nr:hypothetical protein B9Z65_3129 [Elsinoe australis]
MQSAILIGLAALCGFAAAQNATVTRIDTTYTTTTICPITTTSTNAGSTYVVTALTTSTLTVTSCKSGCGSNTTVPGPTASNPISYLPVPTISASNPILYLPVPSPRTETSVYITTETRTVTNFVPHSTVVTTLGPETFYSTWLSIVYATSTSVATRTAYETFFPTPSAVPTSSCPANTVYVTVTAPDLPPAPTVTITRTIKSPSGTPIPPNNIPSYPIPGRPGQPFLTGVYPTNPGSPRPTGASPSGYGPRAYYL